MNRELLLGLSRGGMGSSLWHTKYENKLLVSHRKLRSAQVGFEFTKRVLIIFMSPILK
jgi:hypothetical protein